MNVVTIASEQTGSLSAVASILHDLRNPLATIHGSAEMLVRSSFSQPQVDRIARNIYRASVRMRELLEEFLNRSRAAEKETEPADLRELVASAVDKIAVSAESRSVLIRVRDTGPGIAPEIRSRLFQPFATAGKMSGIGLGLAFSRQTVIDHGGEMWAESSRHGACFAFRLPIDDLTTAPRVMLMPSARKCAEPAQP